MTTQTEAERLADALEKLRIIDEVGSNNPMAKEAAAELRRQASFIKQLMDEVARLQKREWVGLTDEEKRQLFDREDYQGWLDYINAIEAKLKEKNT